MTESPTPAESAAGAADLPPADDGAHLDAIEVEEPEGQEGPRPAMPVTSDGFVTPDAFRDGLGKGLTVSGHMTGLQTLVQGPQLETWPDAAAAIYDTIRETPSLHFLLKPGGKWWLRFAAIGAWGLPVAAGCAQEMKARRQPKPTPDPGPSKPIPEAL